MRKDLQSCTSPLGSDTSVNVRVTEMFEFSICLLVIMFYFMLYNLKEHNFFTANLPYHTAKG